DELVGIRVVEDLRVGLVLVRRLADMSQPRGGKQLGSGAVVDGDVDVDRGHDPRWTGRAGRIPRAGEDAPCAEEVCVETVGDGGPHAEPLPGRWHRARRALQPLRNVALVVTGRRRAGLGRRPTGGAALDIET